MRREELERRAKMPRRIVMDAPHREAAADDLFRHDRYGARGKHRADEDQRAAEPRQGKHGLEGRWLTGQLERDIHAVA